MQHSCDALHLTGSAFPAFSAVEADHHAAAVPLYLNAPYYGAYHPVLCIALYCDALQCLPLDSTVHTAWYYCKPVCKWVAFCVGDLASSEWWKKNQKESVAPDPSPEENLQNVLADVFLEDTQHQRNPFPPSQPLPDLHLPKTAPPNSLLVRQACLLSLWT